MTHNLTLLDVLYHLLKAYRCSHYESLYCRRHFCYSWKHPFLKTMLKKSTSLFIDVCGSYLQGFHSEFTSHCLSLAVCKEFKFTVNPFCYFIPRFYQRYVSSLCPYLDLNCFMIFCSPIIHFDVHMCVRDFYKHFDLIWLLSFTYLLWDWCRPPG